MWPRHNLPVQYPNEKFHMVVVHVARREVNNDSARTLVWVTNILSQVFEAHMARCTVRFCGVCCSVNRVVGECLPMVTIVAAKTAWVSCMCGDDSTLALRCSPTFLCRAECASALLSTPRVGGSAPTHPDTRLVTGAQRSAFVLRCTMRYEDSRRGRQDLT